MSAEPKYTFTNESIVIVWEGRPYTVRSGTPNYHGLKKALLSENWDDIPNHLTVGKSIQEWVKGKFSVDGNIVSYNGEKVPSSLNQRIVLMAANGEDPTPLLKFWERLKKNPSNRSVLQLWDFLQHEGIPLTDDGCFLAYKSVKSDFTDVHSGKFSNRPGVVNEMPRNEISDDPREACHAGFHVGALQYARNFGGDRMVICKVDPMDVVCVPYDHSYQKMRVCRYEVLGLHNGELLPSTAFKEDEVEETSEPKSPEPPPPGDEDYPGYDPDEDPLLDSGEEEDDSEDADDAEEPEEDSDGPVPQARALSVAPKENEQNDSEKQGSSDEKSTEKRKPNKRYPALNKMDMEELMEQSIETLRAYATKGLKIVGASKIPGGKLALVTKIIELRE